MRITKIQRFKLPYASGSIKPRVERSDERRPAVTMTELAKASDGLLRVLSASRLRGLTILASLFPRFAPGALCVGRFAS